MEQKQLRSHKKAPAPEAATTVEKRRVAAEKLKADLDEIIDEIDEVLEEGVEIAKNYVQKGGQ
jgi:ubiquitin-like protein Pup